MKKQFLLGLVAMLLPWTSWAQGQANPQPNTFSVTFTGNDAAAAEEGTFDYKGAVNVGVEVYYNTLAAGQITPEPLDAGENGYAVSCTYQVSRDSEPQTVTDLTTGIKDAGIYTLTVTGTGVYSSVASVTKNFTIEKKGLDLDGLLAKPGAKIQYGASAEDLGVSDVVELTTANGLIDNADNTDALKCLRVLKTTMTGDKIGDAAVVEIGAAEPNMSTNYKYVDGKKNLLVEVEAKDLALSLKEGIEASKEYDGDPIYATDIVADLAIVEGDVVNPVYTITKDGATVTEIKGAGSYIITVSLGGKDAGHYNLTTDNVSYEVTRKNITITGTTLSKTYDGDPVTEAFLKENGNFSVQGLVDGDGVTISMKPSNATKDVANAGKNVVLIMPWVGNRMIIPAELGTDKKPTGNGLDNYTITYSPTYFSIDKRPVKYYFAGGSKDYDGKVVAEPVAEPTVIVEDGTGFVPGSGDDFETKPKAKFAESVEGDVKNAGDYPLAVDTDITVTFKNDSENYTAVFVHDYALPATAESTEDAEPVNVNKYVINKAQFTIRALDHEVKFTTEEGVEALMAELTEYLKITDAKIGYEGGNLDGKNIVRTSVDSGEKNAANAIVKALGMALTIPENVDLTKVGEYEIGFGVETVDAENYFVTLTKGTLKVTGILDIELDGGDDPTTEVAEMLRIYDGATVKTVTVTNLRSLRNSGYKVNYWYTLVLPFDITVRELSNELGYAIVNIPDTNNKKENEFKFKLTMGKVPAGTLMAFKVDGAIDSDTIKLEFKDKKIVAELNSDNAEDLAGHKFVGVYETTSLTEAYQYFLYPAEGSFLDVASFIQKYNLPSLDVYPMNGYFEFGKDTEVDPASVRIVFEEADGSTTAINAITGEVIGENAEGWYTVGGVKLNAQPTQKGVYINNGKKVVIK